jgi:hypothetical protein
VSAASAASAGAGAGVRDAATAQAARAEHDALRAELDARDPSVRDALAHGQRLVRELHPAAQVIHSSLRFSLIKG